MAPENKLEDLVAPVVILQVVLVALVGWSSWNVPLHPYPVGGLVLVVVLISPGFGKGLVIEEQMVTGVRLIPDLARLDPAQDQLLMVDVRYDAVDGEVMYPSQQEGEGVFQSLAGDVLVWTVLLLACLSILLYVHCYFVGQVVEYLLDVPHGVNDGLDG